MQLCMHHPMSRSYWSKSWPFSSDTFSSLMSSRRFELILRSLHLNYSETQPQRGAPGFDKLHKIWPFLNILVESFKESVDESMISFKGRSSLFSLISSEKAPQVGNEGMGVGRFSEWLHV